MNNPRLQSQLFSALQETGNAELSKVARIANTFNVAQDALFRRAIFTASVERQLRGIGMDMYQIMADGKNVPSNILQNAADDALKGTFSYMPKPQRAGQKTYEAAAEGLANNRLSNIGYKKLYPNAKINPLAGWLDSYYDSKKLQVAPQETELSSYVKGVDNTISEGAFDDFKL